MATTSAAAEIPSAAAVFSANQVRIRTFFAACVFATARLY
jgi:hypothetical protein